MDTGFDISHFITLNERIQVIYQGSSRFVLLSLVDETSWTVHVGLSGAEGRWWRGSWSENDFRKLMGSNSTSDMLETFVDQVADAFVEGELYIRDWNAEKGAKINLTFGTSLRMLMNIPLVELSPEDAASFATKMFTEIALEAQSRHCFLHPEDVKPPPVLSLGAAVWPTFSEPSSSKPTPRTPVSQEDIKALASHLAKQRQHMSTSTTNAPENKYKRKAQEAEEEVNVLKAELEKTRLQQQLAATESSKLISRTKPQPAVARRQGASLANPTKKARRYEELKFDSDED